MANQQQPQIDANKVIDKLTAHNSELSKSLAMLQVQYDDLYDDYLRQQELINDYEENKDSQEE